MTDQTKPYSPFDDPPEYHESIAGTKPGSRMADDDRSNTMTDKTDRDLECPSCRRYRIEGGMPCKLRHDDNTMTDDSNYTDARTGRPYRSRPQSEGDDGMTDRLGITRGEARVEPGQLSNGIDNPNFAASVLVENTQEDWSVAAVWDEVDGDPLANARLIADAFNVANRTQKLPSKLARELDIARTALAEIAQDAYDSSDGADDAHPLAKMAARIYGKAIGNVPFGYEDLAAENKRLREALEKAERTFNNIRSAIETEQVVDKDAHGMAVRGRNAARRALARDGEE